MNPLALNMHLRITTQPGSVTVEKKLAFLQNASGSLISM